MPSINPPSSWGESLVAVLMKMVYFGTAMTGLVAALLYTKQDSLLYFPEVGGLPKRPASNPHGYRSPSEYNIPFETHMIRCDDGISIHAWLLLHKNSKANQIPTIIFFHGNAGNIGARLPNAQKMFSQLQANILMVEYRGYGDSDNVKPTEQGLKLDAEGALKFIQSHPEIDSDRIFVFGRSLGGAVAFHLAEYAEQNQRPLAGIMVENTFLSISKMVDQLMPYFAPFKFLVLRINWNSELIAPVVKAPVLYLAGDRDELVPHSHMKELYDLSLKSSSYAKIHIIRKGTHNDSWIKGGKLYFETMRTFISHVLLNGKRGEDTCDVDVDNWETNPDPPVEVTMGDDKNLEKNAIPIMPSNLIGIAKEASKSKTSEVDKKNH